LEIRDPVHGSIHILDEEIPIIRHDFFQRLRGIKQLGFSEYVFPGATHTRFIHSIGVMNIGGKAFQTLFKKQIAESSNKADYKRLEETFKLACLLHDIGHAPLSHSTESVMPMLSELKLDPRYLSEKDKTKDRQATHEDYTIKAITQSSFSESFERVEDIFGVLKTRVADLIVGHTQDDQYFTVDGINIFPILHQLVSGELDCDRMDYLLRDSYFCGVSYGGYDLDWLLDNLEVCNVNGKGYLGITERAVVTFDDFLLSRYHMFLMVYFHYRSVCLEQLLMKYFKEAKGEYFIPADIEAYCEHDDHHLMKVLRKSQNKYAISIVKNQIPSKIFESFNDTQLKKLEMIQTFLEENNIDYIRGSSSGRLSKYYTEDDTHAKFSMKVVRKLTGTNEKIYANINEATDLFSKFSKSHAVNRLHCSLDLLPKNQQLEILKLIQK
jgi:HD superfamily phosphohydrolase